MSWTEALVRLQAVDLELNGARRRLAEVEEELEDDAALRRARTRVQHTQKAAKRAAKRQEEIEFKVQQVETERQQTEAHLYSGRVRNPRELEDLQAKIASLERYRAQLEDQLLEAMIEREETDAEARAATEALQRAEQAWEERHATLTAEAEVLREQIAGLEQQTEELEQQIPTSMLETYRYRQKRFGNPVIARLRGTTCGVCGIEVISSRREAAQQGKETYCDSCGRLLIA
ncbi:MAG: zinc ribbon domain-containing protein [Anaerolineae bacterium]